MKLKLVAAISALAIPALAHAQQSGPQPTVRKPTKADAQNVVQIITSDKVKTQAYCDLTKLEVQVKALPQNTDTKTAETLTKQAEALIDKLGRQELLAVLAHELGHFKLGHVRRRLLLVLGGMLGLFALLGWIADLAVVYQGLGFTAPSGH